jgi:hypothetical protein
MGKWGRVVKVPRRLCREKRKTVRLSPEKLRRTKEQTRKMASKGVKG